MPEHLQPDLDLETTSLSLDCEGDEDRGPDDDPDTDDAYIKVRCEGRRSWTWTGDPLYVIYYTARAAKAAAARYYHRYTLAWWEEEKNYWMAERPGWRMTESWAGAPDDCDDVELDDA